MGPILLDSMVRVPEHMLSDKEIRRIERSLTLKTPDMGDFSYGARKTIEAFYRDGGYISLPRNWEAARELLRRFAYEDRRAAGRPIGVEFSGIPRKGQTPFVKGLHKGLLQDGFGAIGQAACGFGKTVCAAQLIAMLDTTTLFVVHKEELGKQCARTCLEFLDTEVGWVQGPKLDFEGRKVVVATIQTLYQKDLPEEFLNYFGLVVVDECHRISAPTFSAAISKLPAKYRVGLTATPRRGDRMEDLFFWHLGEIESIGRGQFLDCIVWQIHYEPHLHPGQYQFRGKPHMGRLITALAGDSDRTAMLVRTAAKATRASRKVLILSDRVAHLEDMQQRLERLFKAKRESYTIGIFGAGKTKKAVAARELAAQCDITLGTYQMAMEGLDLPQKDVLILGTPKGDVEQAVGRIRRLFAGKRTPTIIDVCDDIGILRGMAGKRTRYYRTPGDDKGVWPVKAVG